MKKLKYLTMALFIGIALFLMPNFSNAAVGVTRTIPSNDGSIIINLTGLTLDNSKQYSYALTTKGGTPKEWHTITDYTTTTAKVNLLPTTMDIRDVLKVTDLGILYVKDNSNNNYVVNALEVNLKLPLINGLEYSKQFYAISNSTSYWAKGLYGAIGNYVNGEAYYLTQKVTDRTLVEEFLKIKNSNGNIRDLEKSLPKIPDTGYKTNSESIKNDGLYLVWVRLTGENCKDVYGCIVHDGLTEATKVEQYIQGLDVEKPTVNSITVASPVSGTYKTSQTVKIHVNFSEKISGTSVPTLKIRFGESAERSITNGTIKDTYIEYSYNIQDEDKGQLATVSLEGGAIVDASNNKAELSCPIISGTITIKANVEGTTTNNTDNQDKNNNSNNGANANGNTGSNQGTTNNNNKTPTNTNNNKPQNNTNATQNNDNSTQAKGKLPQTGVGIGTTVAIIAILSVGIFLFFKYNGLRDIK